MEMIEMNFPVSQRC